MPRDWSNWKTSSQVKGEISVSISTETKNQMNENEQCEQLNSPRLSSRSSLVSVDSGFFSCEEDFREKVESINAEKLDIWLKSVLGKRTSYIEQTTENFDGEIVKIDPYENIQDFQYDWEGSLDSEGRFHGRGLLSLPDGGEIFGVWKNGVR